MHLIEHNKTTGGVERYPNHSVHVPKKFQRTNKCKGTMHFRKSQGYMSL